MRMSLDVDDPSFNHMAIYAVARLDGEILGGCITADEEAGECVCYVRENGVLQWDGNPAQLGSKPRTEIRRGVVSISWERLPEGYSVQDVIAMGKNPNGRQAFINATGATQ